MFILSDLECKSEGSVFFSFRTFGAPAKKRPTAIANASKKKRGLFAAEDRKIEKGKEQRQSFLYTVHISTELHTKRKEKNFFFHSILNI